MDTSRQTVLMTLEEEFQQACEAAVEESRRASALGDLACQTVFAPETDGARLVDVPGGAARREGEIRLTYRELTALIEAAVRELK